MKKFNQLTVFENMKEIVDPAHTALVLWDCQNWLVKNSFNREEFLVNVQGLLAAARRQKVPVIYTKITPFPAGCISSWQAYQGMKRANVDDPAKIPNMFKPGNPEAEIHTGLSPAEDEIVLNKYTPNIFLGTIFGQLMQQRGIETILFTGISTEVGIDHSAREASARGFYTVVVSDCVSSSDRGMHEAALKILPKLCMVMPSRDIIREW